MGSGDRPYTKPCSSESGLGLVTRLIRTVTAAHTSQDQMNRYRFSAIGLACEDRARIASAPGWSFPHSHSTFDDDVPNSSPQKPPAGVARFQSMPRITVANSGIMKKPNNAWT